MPSSTKKQFGARSRGGNCDHETDDHHDGHRRRSDAGTRRCGRGPQGRIRARRMGHVAAAVGELKARPGGELQVHGSGALIRWLLDNQLVDESTLLTVPVVVGQGTRLFPDTGPDIAFDVVDSRVTPKGVTIEIYRPTGRPHH